MEIIAKNLAYSYNPNTKDSLATFEIVFPKVLLAELNTHKDLSRNYSSSRAIPSTKFVQIDNFEPLYWGKNQAGMVAQNEELEERIRNQAESVWRYLVDECEKGTQKLAELGLHKQWANRPCDWHNMAKGVISATNWESFLWLRDADDAQPVIQVLAKQIKHFFDNNEPKVLNPGEYHLPYIQGIRDNFGVMRYYTLNNNEVTPNDANTISAAQCAATSYRTEMIGLEKAKEIWNKLFATDRPHMSPTEHIATPMGKYEKDSGSLMSFLCNTPGVTHLKKNPLRLCSGNFQGFIQQRAVLEETKNFNLDL